MSFHGLFRRKPLKLRTTSNDMVKTGFSSLGANAEPFGSFHLGKQKPLKPTTKELLECSFRPRRIGQFLKGKRIICSKGS